MDLRKAELTTPIEGKSELWRSVIAASIGTSIEWYDFFLYGSSAAIVFGPLFFPSHDPWSGILLSFATYFVGFIARPIGALVFGHYGDKLGRKGALIASLVLTGAGTFCIALIPPYAVIGSWGAVFLVVLRAIQGIGAGGEWGGAVVLSMEWGAKLRNRGFIASWTQFGVPVGIILSNVALIVAMRVSGDGFLTWGWRIPFLLSAVLVIFGLYIRARIEESPVFNDLADHDQEASAPVIAVMRTHWREVLLTCLMRTGQQAPAFVFLTFFLSYGKAELGLSETFVLATVIAGCMVSLVALPFWGAVSDRLGRRLVYISGATAMFVWSLVYFPLIDTNNTLLIVLASIVLWAAHDMMYGPQAAFTAESFPPSVRYTGASLGYQLASVVSGGPAPIISLYLLQTLGSTAIGVYMAFCALVSILSALMLPDRSQQDL